MSKGPVQKDTTMTKLFVGGLPYHTKDEKLKEHFDRFGDIEEAVVITDRTTGKSKGYGFVTMVSPEDAKKACLDPNPIIEGRKANVNLAFLGAKPRSLGGTIPIAIKPGMHGLSAAGLPGMQLAGLQNQYGIPLGCNLLYSPYQTASGMSSMMAVSPHSPLSTGATTAQYFDYANPYAAAAQYQNAYDPTYAALAAGGFLQPGYTLGAMPQAALADAAAGLAGYAPQQIQERLQ